MTSQALPLTAGVSGDALYKRVYWRLIPLLILTQRANVMHRFVNGRVVQSLGWLSTTVILSLNGVLVWQMLRG